MLLLVTIKNFSELPVNAAEPPVFAIKLKILGDASCTCKSVATMRNARKVIRLIGMI